MLEVLQMGKSCITQQIEEITACQEALENAYFRARDQLESYVQGQMQELESVKSVLLKCEEFADIVKQMFSTTEFGDDLTQLLLQSAKLHDLRPLNVFEFQRHNASVNTADILGIKWKSKILPNGRIANEFSNCSKDSTISTEFYQHWEDRPEFQAILPTKSDIPFYLSILSVYILTEKSVFPYTRIWPLCYFLLYMVRSSVYFIPKSHYSLKKNIVVCVMLGTSLWVLYGLMVVLSMYLYTRNEPGFRMVAIEVGMGVGWLRAGKEAVRCLRQAKVRFPRIAINWI